MYGDKKILFYITLERNSQLNFSNGAKHDCSLWTWLKPMLSIYLLKRIYIWTSMIGYNNENDLKKIALNNIVSLMSWNYKGYCWFFTRIIFKSNVLEHTTTKYLSKK